MSPDLPVVVLDTKEVLRQPSAATSTAGVAPSKRYDRLPPELVQRIVRAHFGRFRACYELGLRSSPNLQGRVEVSFVIERDGRVSAAVGSRDQVANPAVADCVTSRFEGLRFPRCAIRTVVSYPIVFSPGS